jgi:hypothetical protein
MLLISYLLIATVIIEIVNMLPAGIWGRIGILLVVALVLFWLSGHPIIVNMR